MAITWPAGTVNETSRRMGFAAPSSYTKLTFRNSIPRAIRASGCAAGRSLTSECVSRISKMRVDAAIACCRFAFTRLSRFTGVYIMNAAKMNARKSPCVISACEI